MLAIVPTLSLALVLSSALTRKRHANQLVGVIVSLLIAAGALALSTHLIGITAPPFSRRLLVITTSMIALLTDPLYYMDGIIMGVSRLRKPVSGIAYPPREEQIVHICSTVVRIGIALVLLAFAGLACLMWQ